MSRRFWRRLAGCIATSLTLTAAPKPEYRAGVAASETVRAVVIEDSKGRRAVFAHADFPVTRPTADFVAVQLLKFYDLDRASLVVSGNGSGVTDVPAILATIEKALTSISPAALAAGNQISIRTTANCVAIPIAAVCAEGRPIHGPIRAAFQMVDLQHPLQTREAPSPTYPVQAVAIGNVTIVALGGNAPVLKSDTPPIAEPRVRAALASVLKRVQ